mmetsp:Transcript_17486/g.22880  ORF Transcript_17486/g.22880 Transcript_17486/m.22880 type:complete len:81 (-) Transcript_17486:787-1029(-)
MLSCRTHLAALLELSNNFPSAWKNSNSIYDSIWNKNENAYSEDIRFFFLRIALELGKYYELSREKTQAIWVVYKNFLLEF